MFDDVPTRLHLPNGYEEWWHGIAGHLGAIYPFQDTEVPETCSLDIGHLIDARRQRNETVKLDRVALTIKAVHPYLFGNRTLIDGIQRAPWMAYPDKEGRWKPAALPPHGNERPDPDHFVSSLKHSLLDEGRRYLEGASSVGILLSGGMDSRVVAGVVRALQKEAGNAFGVVGLTWGQESSRDVIYAQRIVERFGWDWHHYPITVETLAENIRLMGQMGAEVSPLHLHAMPEVACTEGLDVVLAGSYGDMVGRAEFSGRRVTKLRSVLPKCIDRFGVLRVDALAATKPELYEDVMGTPHLNERTAELRRREIEQHMNYTRRMLQSCMLYIAREIPLYQFFTVREVFGQMWALDPAIRGDAWYRLLLRRLPGGLLDIPWARTGCRYDRPNDPADRYSRQHHAYGNWLRGELRDDVLRRVNSERIRGLGLLNERGFDRALHTWSRAGTVSTNTLDELLAWLASLHDFLEIYRIEPDQELYRPSWKDDISALRGNLYGRLYIGAREWLRD